jgi:hypothetical protein
MLYDKIRDVFEKPINIMYKCEKCENEFVNRELFVQKNRIKIYCKTCNCCNKTLKIGGTKNINGERITHKSNIELKFIKFCAKNNILLINGPTVEYIWNNTTKKYVISFEIPKLGYLIELRDDDIWHKNQEKNGIWECKIEAVREKIEEKRYNDYILIFQKKYVEKIKFILSKI